MNPAIRYQTKETAHIEVYGHIGILIADLKNISETGASLEVSEGTYIPTQGDLLNLTINLDSLHRTHTVSAEVIWTQGVQLGICFINKDQILERMMAKVGSF